MPGSIGPIVQLYQDGTCLRSYPSKPYMNLDCYRLDSYLELDNGKSDFEIMIWLPPWMPIIGDFMIAEIIFDGTRTLPCPLESPRYQTDQEPPGRQTVLETYRVEDGRGPFRFTPSILPGNQLGKIMVTLTHGRHGVPTLSEHESVPSVGYPIERVGGRRHALVFYFEYGTKEKLRAHDVIFDEQIKSEEQVNAEKPEHRGSSDGENGSALLSKQERRSVSSAVRMTDPEGRVLDFKSRR